MNHTITIHVDSQGNMTYTPALLRANAGDYVVWQCADGDFAVSFGRSPFQTGSYFQGNSSTPTSPQQVATGASGSYHYGVGVRRNEDGKLWMNPGSPEIFI